MRCVDASEGRPEIAFTFDDPKIQHGANLRWCLPAGESLGWALGKESGRVSPSFAILEKMPFYDNPRMDALRL